MSKPIPLATPDGVVLAYACGTCWRVCIDGETLAPDPREAALQRAELSLEQATDCCVCRGCGAQVKNTVFECEACRAAQAAARKPELEEIAAKAKRGAEVHAEHLARAADSDVATLLAFRMHELSEEGYFSSWCVGIERILWAAVVGDLAPKPGEEFVRFGWAGSMNRSEIEELRRLSSKAGGWFHTDPEHGPLFVTTERWLSLYDRSKIDRYEDDEVEESQGPGEGKEPNE